MMANCLSVPKVKWEIVGGTTLADVEDPLHFAPWHGDGAAAKGQ